MESEDDVYLPFHRLPSEARVVRYTWCCLWGPNPISYAVLIALIAASCSIVSGTICYYSIDRRRLLITFGVHLVLFFITKVINRGDPGRIPHDGDLDFYMMSAEPAKMVIINGTKIVQRWCPFCHIYKPPRSKHCHDCNACIINYDHHCPWLSNCIGNDNHKMFVLLLAYTLAALCYSLNTSITIAIDSYPRDTFDAHFYSFLIYKETTLLIIIVLYALASILCLFCLLMKIYLVLSNITDHEFLTCAYPAGNPFDKGIRENTLEFLNKPLFPSRLR